MIRIFFEWVFFIVAIILVGAVLILALPIVLIWDAIDIMDRWANGKT
jgi:hypothetical protein